jgi:CheY-like chemotaxis protein
MANKILVIDDEQDMRIYLSTLFKKAGYEVEVAANGNEGLEAAASFGPDLITLDILMPKKSGVRAFRELRLSEGSKDTPIIVLTGLTQQEDFFAEGLDDLKGPDAIVEKPIEREEFLETVAGLIGS